MHKAKFFSKNGNFIEKWLIYFIEVLFHHKPQQTDEIKKLFRFFIFFLIMNIRFFSRNTSMSSERKKTENLLSNIKLIMILNFTMKNDSLLF